MIKSLKATGVNGRMSFDLQFHEDINIVTGKNGSGKTTLLKLLWYAISGNLERIIPEIRFESFELETDKVSVGMVRETKPKRTIVKLIHQIGSGEKKEIEKPFERSTRWEELMEVNRQIARASGSSVFFPTFRRIEGGFSISTRRDEEIVRYIEGGVLTTASGIYFGADHAAIQQAMNQLSDRMSVGAHRFVASISTDDINRLVTSKYAEISEKNNRLHMDLSSFILKQVSEQTSDDAGTGKQEEHTKETLGEIRQRARHVTEESETLLRPFTVLSELMSQIFQYKGIKLAGPVTLGEARDAITSEVLSAGEKQMLSFLCYNAFAKDSCLFIDEPEISLHVDWQRILFPVLLKQSTGNQFIVATHSPFIYSKYADKELVLASERGDEHADALTDREGDYRLPRENEPADAPGGR
jgi:predicted ATPase